MNEETSELMNEEWLPAGNSLVSFNQKSYNSRVSHWQSWCEKIEKCIADFNSLNIGTFRPAELYLLFSSPETYVQVRRLQNLGNAPIDAHGGTMNKLKLLEMMEMPNGYDLFLKQIAWVNDQIDRYINQDRDTFFAKTLKDFLSFFTFNNEGKMIISEAVYEEIKKLSTRYVHSDKAKKAVLFAAEFKKFIDKSGITDMTKKSTFGEFISSVLEFYPDKFELRINYDYVKKFDKE